MSAEVNLREFLDESEEIIEAINRDLLALDQTVRHGKGKLDPAVINNIFRGAHSLKGISGLFGFAEMTQLSHTLETLLDRLRMGKVQLNTRVLDLLFESIEQLRQIVVRKGGGQAGTAPGIPDLLHRLEHVDMPETLEEEDIFARAGIGPDILSVLTEYEEHRLKENLREGVGIYQFRASFSLDTFDEELGQLQKTAKTLGEVITTLPSAEASSEEQITFLLLVGSDHALEQMQEAVAGSAVEVKELKPRSKDRPATLPAREEPRPEEPVVAEPAEAAEVVEIGAEGSLRSISQTVRVDIKKLDNLMNIVGELVLGKNIIAQLIERLKAEAGFSELMIELFKANRTLERKLSELQQGVLEVRMVPIGQVFDKLSRNIRKLSRELGKEVDFVTEGGQTELDKLIIEDLADPLMHVIRNAVDHGIESKPERIQLGKPARGLILLRAFQRGNHVVIEIQDDGAGLDYGRIRKKAVAMGLIESAAEPKPEELNELLFLPGFSTAEKVSEISGRGVGLDVVKSNISALSGAIDLIGRAGEGTTVTITLPITLAIIQALIIEAGTETFAIPLNAVQESLVINPKQIQTIEGKEVIELRERTLPLLRLARFFGIKARLATPEEREYQTEEMFVVKVGIAEKRLGLVVDKLRGRQDIVIKSVGDALKDIKGIAGATELGTEKTILVLDVLDLMEEAAAGAFGSARAAGAGA